MKRYLQRKYALSDRGAKDMVRGILWSTLLNLFLLAPACYVFLFLSDYIQNGVISYTLLQYVLAGVMIFVAILIVAVIQYNSVYTAVYNESGKSRVTLAETLRRLPLAYFGEKNLSDLTSTIMEDCSFGEQIYSHAIPQLYASCLSLLLISAGLLGYNWQLGVALLWVVPVALLLILLSRAILKRSMKGTFDAKRKVSESIQEGITLIEEIKAYNGELSYLSSFDRKLRSYEKQLVKGELICGVILNISYMILYLGPVSLLVVGAHLLSQGEVSLFDYLIYLVLGSGIFLPILEVCNNIAMLEALQVRVDRAKEIHNMPLMSGYKKFVPGSFDIEFRDVSFSYLEGQKVLQHVSFTAKQGEVTALVGGSGGGKSTSVKLAARFWDPTSGQVLLGGVDISTVDPERLLRWYSVVFQDVLLFNTSVADNIRVGKPGASDEEVRRVARLAQCEEFIDKLPQGYHTLIGENGSHLSGGERQRISIARAILKDAPIILLDEATASLDVENESKIQQALSVLIKDKTVIIIAHRMRTIANADKVVVLNRGRVDEMGKPSELLARPGAFARMVSLQMET